MKRRRHVIGTPTREDLAAAAVRRRRVRGTPTLEDLGRAALAFVLAGDVALECERERNAATRTGHGDLLTEDATKPCFKVVVGYSGGEDVVAEDLPIERWCAACVWSRDRHLAYLKVAQLRGAALRQLRRLARRVGAAACSPSRPEPEEAR